jgi:hypothetical protein
MQGKSSFFKWNYGLKTNTILAIVRPCYWLLPFCLLVFYKNCVKLKNSVYLLLKLQLKQLLKCKMANKESSDF